MFVPITISKVKKKTKHIKHKRNQNSYSTFTHSFSRSLQIRSRWPLVMLMIKGEVLTFIHGAER